MSLSGFAGGASDALEQIIKQRFLEQVQKQRAAQEQAELAEQMRQADMSHGLGRDRLGLDRDKLAQDDRQFGVSSGLENRKVTLDEQAQPVRLKQMGAQTEHLEADTVELKRRPQKEQQERDFTTGRDAQLNKYELGQIGARTAGDERIASIRQRPRIQKIVGQNAQGQAVHKFIDVDTGAVIHEELAGSTSTKTPEQIFAEREAAAKGAEAGKGKKSGVIDLVKGVFGGGEKRIIKMIAPDGRSLSVPEDQVENMKAHGAKVVGG